MEDKKRLIKSFAYYFLGTIGPRLISLFLFPFLTFFITKEELGLYDFIIVLISLVLPVYSLQISFATYRWLIDNDNDNDNDNDKQIGVIINSLLVCLTSCSFFSILFFIISLYSSADGFLGSYLIEFLVIMVAVSFFNIFQQISRGLGQLKYYTISGIINTIFVFVFSFIFIFIFNDKVKGLLWAYFLGNFSALIYLVLNLNFWKKISISGINVKELKKLIFYSLPFIPNSMSITAVSFINRYLITSYFSMALMGVFALASKLAMIIYVINSIFILVMQDNLIKNKKINRDYFLLKKFINFQIGLSLILLSISPLIFKLISSPEYYDAWKYFPILCLLNSYNAIASYLAIDYQKNGKTLKLMLTTLVSALLGCFLSFFLLGYGMYGLLTGGLLGGLFYIFIIDKDLIYGGVGYFKILFYLFLFFLELILLNFLNSISFLNIVIIVFNLMIFFVLNKDLVKSVQGLIKLGGSNGN